MSENITDASQAPAEQPNGATLLEKMSEATQVLIEAQEKLVQAAADVAKHTTDPNAHGAATLANIVKAMPKPVLEDGMLTFKDAEGNVLVEPVNLKGEPGTKGDPGEKGDDGEKGDMPDHQWDGTSLQLQKPDGTWDEPVNLKGDPGIDGAPGQAPEHQWNGTSLQFKKPDGTWGEAQDLQGPKGNDGTDGKDGAPGTMPDHQWDGTSLQIQKPDGSWGEPVNLKGEQGVKGDPGDAAIATVEQPGIVQPDGVTATVDEEGLLSALGGNLLLNSEVWITASGEWEAPVTGWYEALIINGGQGGFVNKDATVRQCVGGLSGRFDTILLFLEAGESVPVTIGAGSQGVVAAGTSPTPAAGGATSFKGHSPRFSNASAGAVVQALDTNRAAEAAGGGPGGGIGHFNPNPGTFYGAGGGAYYSSGNPRAGAGLQGAVRLRWHDPATAAGAAPALFSLAAEGMAAGMRTAAPRAAAEPVTLNLYDPATGQGSVWREEDALAKLAEGMLSEETWLEICAAKAAEEHAAWLADPATEAERFEMLRQARDARLAATDYLTAADYPLPDEQRTAVTAYRQGLRDLPAQPGAPWDGGGELTPWPELPSMLQPAVQPEEPVQSENTEV